MNRKSIAITVELRINSVPEGTYLDIDRLGVVLDNVRLVEILQAGHYVPVQGTLLAGYVVKSVEQK